MLDADVVHQYVQPAQVALHAADHVPGAARRLCNGCACSAGASRGQAVDQRREQSRGPLRGSGRTSSAINELHGADGRTRTQLLSDVRAPRFGWPRRQSLAKAHRISAGCITLAALCPHLTPNSPSTAVTLARSSSAGARPVRHGRGQPGRGCSDQAGRQRGPTVHDHIGARLCQPSEHSQPNALR